MEKIWLSGEETVKSNHDSEKLGKQGRPRSPKQLDKFFLTICRLIQGFPKQYLANLFHISRSTVSRFLATLINFKYLKLG